MKKNSYACTCKKPKPAYDWDGARCVNKNCGKLIGKTKYVMNLVVVTFVGREKISERIVKKNLTAEDLEIIDILRRTDET